jgi:Uma2 family endonuclease
MARAPSTGLTYADLLAMPEDAVRRELLDGELVVSAAPAPAHQRVVMRLGRALLEHVEAHGGEAFAAPLDTVFSDQRVLQPELLALRAEHAGRVTDRGVSGPPDLVIEVLSPSSRHRDLVRKRAIYEEHGVGELWFVDLEAESVEVHALEGDAVGQPRRVSRGETVSSEALPGFAVGVDVVLG